MAGSVYAASLIWCLRQHRHWSMKSTMSSGLYWTLVLVIISLNISLTSVSFNAFTVFSFVSRGTSLIEGIFIVLSLKANLFALGEVSVSSFLLLGDSQPLCSLCFLRLAASFSWLSTRFVGSLVSSLIYDES